MSPGSSLDIGVSLVLPESPGNFAVGTFAVGATVFDKQGKAVGAGSRSMVMVHKSTLLQYLSTLFYALPLVLSLTSEHQVPP
ncbi:hypothetical protein T484DRAFT_1812348 [Baffinella frigidus]|nr:hypothetical protein T484DRAFT_1812348 [Cryptophyta sp. CCMP2293]